MEPGFTHTTIMLAPSVIRRLTDADCSNGRINRTATRQIQLNLTQNAQYIFFRKSLPCHRPPLQRREKYAKRGSVIGAGQLKEATGSA